MAGKQKNTKDKAMQEVAKENVNAEEGAAAEENTETEESVAGEESIAAEESVAAEENAAADESASTEERVTFYVRPVEEVILIRSTPEFLTDNSNVAGELRNQEEVPIVRTENGYGKLPDGYMDGIKGEAWIQLCFTKKCC